MASNNLVMRSSEGNKKSLGKELRKDFLFDEKYLNLNHGKKRSQVSSLSYVDICIL
jgi:hypothetical protein